MAEKDINSAKIDGLVREAQGGDTDAFAKIYDEYFSHVYRYVYYRVDKAEVDDIVAQVFMKAWDNLRKYEERGISFGAWLFRIAHNLVVDQYRVHRGLLEIPADFPDEREEADPRHMAKLKLDQIALKAALSRLKEVYRQVIVLKYINGLSNREIAHVLNRREGNIRILQFRALKELKEILGSR